MKQELFNAILSMDAYNRGYGAGIIFGSNPGTNNYSLDTQGISIGTAAIYRNKGDVPAQAIGFYAIAYQDTSTGVITISYRGTDNISQDPLTGWTLGGGDTSSPQGEMAIQFYQSVAGEGNWLNANISLTGHSLGGGLAGYVGAIYDQNATVFDSMTFESAANNAYIVANGYSVTWVDNITGISSDPPPINESGSRVNLGILWTHLRRNRNGSEEIYDGADYRVFASG